MKTDEPRNIFGGPRRGGGEDAADERMEDWYGDNATSEFEEGEVVRGRVVYVGTGEVLVDVGYKSEGAIPIEEFHRAGKLPSVATIDVYLEARRTRGLIVSPRKPTRFALGPITQAFEREFPRWTVVEAVRALAVDWAQGLLPARRLTSSGRTSAAIPDHRPRSHLNRRGSFLSRAPSHEKARGEEEHTLRCSRGLVLTGTVKNITDYGGS